MAGAQERVARQLEVEGWPVSLVSYCIGDTYYCEVANVEPGARIARAQGESREAAETAALDDAARRLARTRRRDDQSGT